MLTSFKEFLREATEVSDTSHEKIKKKVFDKLSHKTGSEFKKIVREFKPLVSGTVDSYYVKGRPDIKGDFAESARNVNDKIHALTSKRKPDLHHFKDAHDAILDHLHHHSKTLNDQHSTTMKRLANNTLLKEYENAKIKHKSKSNIRKGAVGAAALGTAGAAALISAAKGLAEEHLDEALDPDLHDFKEESFEKLKGKSQDEIVSELKTWHNALGKVKERHGGEAGLSARYALDRFKRGNLESVHDAIVHHLDNHGTKGMTPKVKEKVAETNIAKDHEEFRKKIRKKTYSPKRRTPKVKKKDIEGWKKYVPYSPTRITGKSTKKDKDTNESFISFKDYLKLSEEMGAGAIASGPVKGNTTDSVEIYDKPLGKKKKPDVVRRKPVDAVLLGKFR